MSKILFLLRHAKSSWKDLSCSDHDRTLNKRGLRDAPQMAQWMLDNGHQPEWMICSTATRTQATAEALEKVFAQSIPLQLENRLYMAGPGTLLQCIASQAPNSSNAIAVGHNPGLEEVAHRLTGAAVRIPTATLVSIELPIESWSELSLETQGHLNFVMRPKMLA